VVPFVLLGIAIVYLSILVGGYVCSAKPVIIVSVFGALLISRTEPARGIVVLVALLPLQGCGPGTFNPLTAFAVTALLCWLLRSYQSGGLGLPTGRLLRWLALFASVCAVSLLSRVIPYCLSLDEPLRQFFHEALRAGPQNPLYGIGSVHELISAIGVAVFLITTIRGPGPVRRLQEVLLAAHSALLVIGFFEYFGLISLLWYRPYSAVIAASSYSHRFTSLFSHPSWYAQYLVLMCPLILSHRSLSRGRARLVLTTVFGLTVASLILTYQRGGWISALCAIGCILWLNRSRSAPRTRWSSVRWGYLCIGVALAVTVLFRMDHPLSRRLAEVPQNLSGRSNLWLCSWEMFKARPFFGHGFNTFAWVYREMFPRTHPLWSECSDTAHNGYFQLLAGCGIVGLIVWIGFVLVCVALGVSASGSVDVTVRTLARGTLSGVCGFLVYGFVQEFSYVYALQMIFFLHVASLGILARQSAPDSESDQKSSGSRMTPIGGS